MGIKGNVQEVLEKIEKSASKTGRSGRDVQLVAVSKTVPAARVEEAIEDGLHTFGENRVQE